MRATKGLATGNRRSATSGEETHTHTIPQVNGERLAHAGLGESFRCSLASSVIWVVTKFRRRA